MDMDSVDGSRFVNQSGSDQTLSNACDSCKYHGKQKEASHFCKTCHEKLCKSCKEWHKGFKATRNHKIIPLKDWKIDGKPTITVTCVCDQNLEAVFYCEWHTDVICQACRNLKHKGCEIVSVKEKSTDYNKSKLQSVLKRAEALNKRTDEFIKKRQPELAKQEGVKIDCKIRIQAFHQELECMLDNLQGDAIDQLEKSATQHRKNLISHLSACDTTTEILRSEIELLKDVMKTNEKDLQFAADVKVSNRLEQLESSLEDILDGGESANITFKRNTELVEKLRKTRLGTITLGSRDSRSETESFLEIDVRESLGSHEQRKQIKSFLDLEVESPNHVEIKRSEQEKVPSITGCVFLPSGDAVFCDVNNSDVIILSSTFSYRAKLTLSSSPYDVSVLSKTSVIDTCPGSGQLQYVEVFPKLKTKKTIQLDKKCWGIAIANVEIYVTCHDHKLVGSRDGEIRILGLNGNRKRTLGRNFDGSYKFCWPYYITVNASSGRIFVSDQWTGKVTCIRSSFPRERNELTIYPAPPVSRVSISSNDDAYEYSADDLSYVRGVCVDEKDNVMVCGRRSDNVKVIQASGYLYRTLLTHRDGIKSPQSIAYRKSDNMLMIGCGDTNYLYTKSLDM